jgi:uncharacterized protein (PEP-CTERM system associated)
MIGARPTLRKSPASSGFWHRFRLTLWALLVIGTAAARPATAQLPESGAGNPPSGQGAGEGSPSGATGTTPAFPGAAPTTLPAPPGGGFGFPNPTSSPNSVNNEIPTLVSPPTLRLLGPRAGVVPLQAYNPEAPAILVQPTASIGETFTDNVNFVHSPRKFAAITNLSAGASVSIDTPRLQAVATGQGTGSLYVPRNNSSGIGSNNLNQIYGNLYANGLATVVPDALFVDFQSVVTQSSTLPGFGFQNLSTLPSNQQTQQFIFNASPYIRKSFDGLVDTELRYRFGSVNYGGNTTAVTTPGVPGLTNLSSAILNEGTFIAATGEDFQQALARFTADASDYNTTSTAQNTQVSAFSDLEYRFTPTIAALGRAGYQNLRYPFSPAATFAGATWLIGGRLGTAGPDQPAFVSLQYGKQQGVYGFTGAAQVNITPTMLLTASLVQGIAGQGQLFQSNLANSTLSPSGAIVNQFSGLPTAFYSPGLGLSNNVYRQHLFNVGVVDTIGPNSYSLFGFYNDQQSLTPPITPPTKSIGINFGYSRDIRPDLNGYASAGYVNSNNSPTSVTPVVTSTNNFSTINASLGINYVLSRGLTGSIVYTFTYQSTANFVVAGRTGDAIANQLQFLLSKTF